MAFGHAHGVVVADIITFRAGSASAIDNNTASLITSDMPKNKKPALHQILPIYSEAEFDVAMVVDPRINSKTK